ncbi:hypothetical protein E4U30_004957 [Claviceps sp. LM220 group G6]|nr:hypothetical protein E4U30_004957 [Claviceps sp. LM220 group G6]KAG6094131.1 hypothetical protein E4U31_006404 [Claviceps sp. LM219 group G6]KAG6105590.1 hypothetical protein E4U14_005048 [Claviceps sp. LM454 group G7]
MSESSNCGDVFRVEYLGMSLNHHAIFVQTNSDGSGMLYHVIGSIQKGMTFEHKQGKKPDDASSFIKKTHLGWVTIDKYPFVERICRSVPPPKKQFEVQRRLFPREPLRRCQEWTDEAVEALSSSGILQPGRAPESQGPFDH